MPRNTALAPTIPCPDHYQHADWLGSVRLTSSPSRSYTGSIAYAPFGETYSSSGSPDPSFTGLNPDTVSTNYDATFRQYSTQGRWHSPDPAGLAAVNLANPQSWTRSADGDRGNCWGKRKANAYDGSRCRFQ
jgi:RHS repeat-associated protein